MRKLTPIQHDILRMIAAAGNSYCPDDSTSPEAIRALNDLVKAKRLRIEASTLSDAQVDELIAIIDVRQARLKAKPHQVEQQPADDPFGFDQIERDSIPYRDDERHPGEYLRA